MSAPGDSPAVTAAREALAQSRAAAAAGDAETDAGWAFIAGMLGAALESVLGLPEDPHWIVIQAGWRTALGQLLRDGIDWCRQHTDPDCAACAADPDGQCPEHEQYLGQIGFYKSLAREMGIEVRR